MTVDLTELDAHEQPTDELRGIWKGYAKAELAEIVASQDIDDIHKPEKKAEFKIAGNIPADKLRHALNTFEGGDCYKDQVVNDAPIYHHPLLPGGLDNPRGLSDYYKILTTN